MGKHTEEEKKLFRRLADEYFSEKKIVVNSDNRMREYRSRFIGIKGLIRSVIDDLYEERKIDLKYIYLLNNILGYFAIMMTKDISKYYGIIREDVIYYYDYLKEIWDNLEDKDNSLLALNTTLAIINLKIGDRELKFLNDFNLNYSFSSEEVEKVINIINSDRLEDFYNLFINIYKKMVDKDYKIYIKNEIILKFKKILDERN